MAVGAAGGAGRAEEPDGGRRGGRITLYGFVTELQTLYYPDSPARTRPEKMLDMFREGGTFRGAVHVYTPGAEQRRDVWILLDEGEPVAAAARRENEMLVGRDAVGLVDRLDRLSFVRLNDSMFDEILSEARGTGAVMGAEA